MGSENETVADIVAEMRNESHAGDASCLEWVGAKIRGYADRIEAAMRHQFREATKMILDDKNLLHLCNAAKMREALRQVSRVAVEMTRKTVTGEPEDRKTVDEWALRLCDIVSAALAAPPRNCDIGTPDEHLVRHRKWCWEHDCKPTDSCKLCVARWSQMPYEEVKGETK